MFKQLAGMFKTNANLNLTLPSSSKAAQEATNELAGDAKLAKTCRDAQQMNKVLQRRIARLRKEQREVWDEYFKKESGK